MAGEIPDNEDLTDLFGKKPDDDPNDMMGPGDDDATTNYTKDESSLPKLNPLSLEPIYAPPVGPPDTMRTNANEISDEEKPDL